MNLQTTACTGKLLDSGLGGNLVDGGASVLSGRVTVHLHELGEIELGLFEHFHLSDEDIL